MDETLYLSGKKRVRVFHRKLKGNHMVYLVVSFLLAISFYSYLHLEELKVHPLPQGYFLELDFSFL